MMSNNRLYSGYTDHDGLIGEHPTIEAADKAAKLFYGDEYDEMAEQAVIKRIGPWWCRLTIYPVRVGWTLSARKLQIRWNG